MLWASPGWVLGSWCCWVPGLLPLPLPFLPSLIFHVITIYICLSFASMVNNLLLGECTAVPHSAYPGSIPASQENSQHLSVAGYSAGVLAFSGHPWNRWPHGPRVPHHSPLQLSSCLVDWVSPTRPHLERSTGIILSLIGSFLTDPAPVLLFTYASSFSTCSWENLVWLAWPSKCFHTSYPVSYIHTEEHVIIPVQHNSYQPFSECFTTLKFCLTLMNPFASQPRVAL